MIGRTGVCSWSLRSRGPAELARAIAGLGLTHVQLALGPLCEAAGAQRWPLDETRRALDEAGVGILSGMIGTRGEDYSSLASIRASGGVRPDEHWPANQAAARESAGLARGLGLDLVTLHAGFLPEDRRDPERGKLVDRLRVVADLFGEEGVRVGLETGQERAETLLEVLAEVARPNVGVNFDPANMILYGMGEPVAALEALLPHVLQVHVKDALPAARAGEWGSEVPCGGGAVVWPRFFDVLRAEPRSIDCVIERESGRDRAADVARARDLVASARGRSPRS